MFHIPWVITLSIAATRMYRRLDDFLSSDMYDNRLFLYALCSLRESHCSAHVPPHNGSRRISISGTWDTPAVPIPLDGIRGDVRTAHNHTVTSQAIRHSLGSDMDRQLHDKPHELV
jgi:hypothetical protein